MSASARQENLAQVWRAYDLEGRLRAIAPALALDSAARDHLLRHHRDGGVYDRGEIAARDAFDRFLHACAILEAGFVAGVLSDPDGELTAPLADVLGEAAVANYYGPDRYPLRLPGALLARIRQGGVAPDAPFHPGWFANLLALDARFANPELETFLQLADSFQINGMSMSDLCAIAQNRETIVKAVTTPPRQRSTKERALAGIERFLLFAGDLNLLMAEGSDPILADTAFELYRYWFMAKRSAKLTAVVNAALTALGHDPVGDELPHHATLQGLFDRAGPAG